MRTTPEQRQEGEAMDIYECEREAQKIGFDSAKFKARFPAGVFDCRWLDAYMGLFIVDVEGMRDGFVTTSSMAEQFTDMECFDLKAD